MVQPPPNRSDSFCLLFDLSVLNTEPASVVVFEIGRLRYLSTEETQSLSHARTLLVAEYLQYLTINIHVTIVYEERPLKEGWTINVSYKR